MPAKGFLTQSHKENLQLALNESSCPHFTQKILMLLLMNDGKSYQEISVFLGSSYRTVAYWCVHGDTEHLETLKDGREKGNYRKATSEYINLLMSTIEKEPIELGYEFGRWTTARLATYLSEKTGIKLSGEQVRRILNQKKYAYLWARSRRAEYSVRRTRAAKYSLETKQNQSKREAFKEKLRRYLAASEAAPEKIQVWFWDESVFSLRVIRRKTWVKKGKRKNITGKRSCGRVNVMGGVRFHDRKRICYFIDKGNGESFYRQLEQLNEFVKKEWVEQGNQESEFQIIGPKLIIILDNASFHKKKQLEKILKNICPIFNWSFSQNTVPTIT